MNLRWDVWRERWLLWLPAAAFVLLNLFLLGLYGSRFAARGERLERQVTEVQAELAELTGRRDTLWRRLVQRREGERRLVSFYEERLGTEAERLTSTLRQVKELAGRAGLRPSAIAYSSEAMEGFGVERLGLSFGVEGNWRQLRQFVNLLELADPFLILEDVQLSGSPRGGRLRINLGLSTAFALSDWRRSRESAS